MSAHTPGPRERAYAAAQGSTHESNDTYTYRKSREAKREAMPVHHDGECEVLNLKEYDTCFCAARAAAPELLEACEAIETFWPDKVTVHPDVKMLLFKVQAAIRAAKGEAHA